MRISLASAEGTVRTTEHPSASSAASERLFSCAGIVMNSRRTRMSDALFEELVLLKQNKAVTQ